MPSALQLVVVTSSFPIRGDGSEAAGSFVGDLALALAAHVRVCVVAPGPESGREQWAPSVEVLRFAAPMQALSTLKPWRPDHLVWILRVLRGGNLATQAAVADGADLVIALWGLPCGEWAMRATRNTGVPYAVWLLGSDVWALGRIPLLRGALARVIRRSTRAFADGYGLAAEAERISGAPIAFLPSTRTVARADASEPRNRSPYRLLFLGRWHPNKGIDLLLEALTKLDDADWQRIERVKIHGGGPLDALVRSRVADLRARSRPVELGGYLAKREAECAIARADWLLIPSRIESIPVVFSDAMKLGRPVVSTPVGDLGRLLSELRVGVCSMEASPESFAEALRSALRNSAAEYRDALARAAIPFSFEQSIVPTILEMMHATPENRA